VKLDSARARGAAFQVPTADGKTVSLGVVTLPAFYGPADEGDTDADKTSATEDVSKIVAQLKAAHVHGIVLDLRHNGGGYLSEAIEVAGLFIHQGPVVQVKGYDGEIQVDSDKGESLTYDGPMAVLVDRFSASASEIVAGALKDYGRAVVIGDSSTHGKGTVQATFEMKKISRELAQSPAKTGAAKITIQKFYLPDGSSTQLKGVVSDIILPSVDEYLPIGESDLPHALVWDKIATSSFKGAPIDSKILDVLKKDSEARQAALPEFGSRTARPRSSCRSTWSSAASRRFPTTSSARRSRPSATSSPSPTTRSRSSGSVLPCPRRSWRPRPQAPTPRR
jgi:carboxyl-terminal processing protease